MSRQQLLGRCILVLFMSVMSSALVHAQTATSVVFPRFMEGATPTNIDRLPFACRLRLSGLIANRTYRYFNQMVVSSDPSNSNGSGNAIFANPSGDFTRSISVSLSSLGNYGTFNTDGTGTYEGWFITEPTGSTRFTPGKFVFMRIAVNDGAIGTTVANRITTTDSVRVVKLAPGATDSTGTGLRGSSFAKPADFVFVYDNTTGSGRPISGSLIESDGTNNSVSNLYSPFYGNSVNEVRGAYGMVLPNLLAAGIRRVERRSLASGTVVASATDADGTWPSGAHTVNPLGGATAVVLTSADVNYLTSGLALDPSSRSFGNVAVSTSKTDSVLAKNTTGASLTISSMVSSDTSAFVVTTTTPVTLSAGATKYIRIVFHPRVAGQKDTRITFTHTALTSPDTIHVDGNGIMVATSLIMPRFMEGQFPINIGRIPFACRLRLSKLAANTTYRYYNQVVNSFDGPNADGGGNPIFATPSGDFVRTQNVNFDSTGDYGTFTTDATGTYDGWFITEPTAGDRFLPGKFVFMRIMLNGGGIGTTVATRITTTDSVRVVKLAPGATDSTGTGLRGISFAKSRDFVFTYDNTAGTGRPISGSFVEDDGTKNSLSNFYSPFYADTVDGVRGAYGMVLPNLLSTGVRRVERRALAGGAIVTSITDSDGKWPSGAQTVNPVSGSTSIALTGADVNYLTTGLALDPSSLSFGDIVSTSKTDSVLAKNTTSSSMTISSIVSSDTSSFVVTTTTPVSLSSGSTKYIRIVFHPRFPGKKDARITFTNSGNTSPDTIHVDGNSIALATSLIMPRFMEGQFPINIGRIPFACRLRLSKLAANTTYRYYNQAVNSFDGPNADGGGNPIFATPSGDFVRTQKVDFDSTGDYGTFTTDATGTYDGWFITEPTAGDRFLPGKFVFMRIMLNGGGIGTTVATRITTTDSVRVVKLAPGATDSTGTGLRGISFAKSRDFVFTYDNTAGTGRPISGSFIEDDGTKNSLSNFYSPFYADTVDGVRGAYGMVLPNLLSTGVRRVERRALADGAIVASATDADGKWPSGAQTVNPVSGTTSIALTGADVNYLTTGLALDPSSLSFPDIVVSASKTDSVLAKNTSGSSMTISSIVSSDTSSFAVTTTTPVSLSSGSTKYIRIVFHPRFPGKKDARITFTNSGNTSPDTIHVDGHGLAIATSVILPRYMEGIIGINSNRIPFACRLQLSKLLASTTYRYYNQVVTSSDDPRADGGGNPIFASLSGSFVRTVTVDFDTTGHYGTFTTDATGTYEGWFVTEPTGGSRFFPGQFVFMRINLNAGGAGTTVATRVTTSDSVRIVKLNGAATDSTGTGLRGASFASARDFIFTYDNTAGTGRPISGSFVESDGTANTAANFYSPFYASNVDGLAGAYGMVLPNLLPTGVRRVERRSLASGAIVGSATDADGRWPSGVQTVNPAGGSTAIALTGADVGYLSNGLVLTPSSLAFGDVAVSTSKTDSVFAKNKAGQAVTISSIVSSDTSAFAVTTTSGPVTLQPGDSTKVRIVFHPRVVGQRSGRITLTNTGPTSPDTLHLSGNGAILSIAISPSPLLIGAVSIVATQLDSLRVRNPGNGTLSITSIVSSNPTQFEVVNGGPVSVLPGDSVSIRLKFHPTAIGQKDGRITVTHNAATSPDTVHVQGRGVQLTATVPRYLEGAMGTNTNRIPFAYRVSFAGLLASHAYRYFNLVVTSADPANSNGGGNCIFASADSAFVRSTSPDLVTPGNYGTLTTDSTGVCQGWFVTEPTANQRFTPGGFVFMRICINDGGAGTTVFGRLTPVDSVRVVKLGPAPADSVGTGLRGVAGNARDFVFVYDDSAGAGRPVSGSFIENDGTINSSGNGFAQFYSDHVDTVGGAFGVVVPNVLPKGIRRIERRSLVSGAVIDFTNDVDGIWPDGANTVNPTGGTTEIVMTAADWIYTTAVEPGPGVVRRFMLAQSGPNPFHRTTTIRFSVAEPAVTTLVVYDILGAAVAVPFSGLATPGQEYAVTVDAKRLPSGVYLYRLKSGNRTATKKMLLIR